jgi:Ran GTPase-activating protein (RanGAP) involved in mRNA processing and transport
MKKSHKITVNLSKNRASQKFLEENTKIIENLNSARKMINLDENKEFCDMVVIEDTKEQKTAVDLSEKVANVFKHKSDIIEQIDLDSKVNKGSLVSIAESLKTNTGLKILSLKSNSVNDEGATLMGKALKKNSSLTDLDLAFNEIYEKGATGLCTGLIMNRTLTRLNIANNFIRNEGARILGETLKKNKILVYLNISENEITNEGAGYLFEGLSNNSSLEELILDNNKLNLVKQISDEIIKEENQTSDQNNDNVLNENEELYQQEVVTTIKSIQVTGPTKNGFEYFKKCCLKKLDLVNCFLDQEEGLNLFKALAENDTLEKLNLSHNNLDMDCFYQIFIIMKKNTKIKEIYFTENKKQNVKPTVASEDFYNAIMETNFSKVWFFYTIPPEFWDYISNSSKSFHPKEVYY